MRNSSKHQNGGRRPIHSVVALMMPLAAFALQKVLWPVIGPHVWFLFFFPAVFASSWLGGLRAGLVATGLSAVLVWWGFVPPAFSGRYPFAATVFCAMGTLFAIFHAHLRAANRVAAAAREDGRRQEERQRFLAEASALFASTLDLEETLTNVADLAVRELGEVCVIELVDETGRVERARASCSDPSRRWICDALRATSPDPSRHAIWSVLARRENLVIERLTPEFVASHAQSSEHLAALRALDPKSVLAVPLVARGKLRGALSLLATEVSAFGADQIRLAEELALRAGLAIDNASLYQSAQRAIAARDEVHGVVAHDLRNPLTSVVMQAALLRRNVATGLGAQRAAEAIERAARRMNRIIEDLLAVSQLEAGSLSIERTPVPAAQVLREAAEAEGELASAASLELCVDAPRDLPDVSADRDRLLQIFENLVGNAIKFCTRGGRITLGAEVHDAGVLFSVADSGPGIARADLPHVFDRFWQGTRRGPRGKGAGLGLPIVKGLVEAQGGRIWVESAPGEGTTVFFTIPRAPHAELRAESASYAP